jgi:DNA-binding PadR family transcriptional regulator
MEGAGYVKAVEAAARAKPTIPMTGSLAGELAAARSRQSTPEPSRKRPRKVYGITAKGEARLGELLTDQSGVTTSAGFGLRLALFSHLTPAQRLVLIEQRQAVLAARRADLQQSVPADRYQFARQTRELAMIDYDLAWLANLARAEQAQHTLGGNP